MAKLVTIYQPKDEAEHLAVTSLLDAADIPYYSKNTGAQSIFGGGQASTGFNVLSGQTEIQVPKPFVEKAEEVLDVYLTDNQDTSEFTIPEYCPACNTATWGESVCPDCGLMFAPGDDSE